ncbi:MAG: hypothetical protein K2W95_23490 [Candidatus Obscuribacterales bacterium]|nr:hypothetical protein [Candidatus Obscuribacterales bacterium]
MKAPKLIVILFGLGLFVSTARSACALDQNELMQQFNTQHAEGLTLIKQAKYKDAENKFRQLIAFHRTNPGPKNLCLALSLQGLALSLDKQDKGGDSWKVTQEANKLLSAGLAQTGVGVPIATGLTAITNTADTSIKAYESKYGSMNGMQARTAEAYVRARNVSIKANMRSVQIAAESYASDFSHYPTKLDTAFQSYFMEGGNDGKQPGLAPQNPLTKAREWPLVLKTGETKSSPSAGTVIYMCTPNGKSYSIYGVGADGKYLLDAKTNKTLVYAGAR